MSNNQRIDQFNHPSFERYSDQSMYNQNEPSTTSSAKLLHPSRNILSVNTLGVRSPVISAINQSIDQSITPLTSRSKRKWSSTSAESQSPSPRRPYPINQSINQPIITHSSEQSLSPFTLSSPSNQPNDQFVNESITLSHISQLPDHSNHLSIAHPRRTKRSKSFSIDDRPNNQSNIQSNNQSNSQSNNESKQSSVQGSPTDRFVGQSVSQSNNQAVSMDYWDSMQTRARAATTPINQPNKRLINQTIIQPVLQPISHLTQTAKPQLYNDIVDHAPKPSKQSIKQTINQSVNQIQFILPSAILARKAAAAAARAVGQSNNQTINQSNNSSRQSNNQSINQSSNQPINQTVNQTINQSTEQLLESPFCLPQPAPLEAISPLCIDDQPVKPLLNQSTNQPINQPTNQTNNQSTNQTSSQTISQTINQTINPPNKPPGRRLPPAIKIPSFVSPPHQLINQSINQTNNQPIATTSAFAAQQAAQPIHQSTNQQINRPKDSSNNQPPTQSTRWKRLSSTFKMQQRWLKYRSNNRSADQPTNQDSSDDEDMPDASPEQSTHRHSNCQSISQPSIAGWLNNTTTHQPSRLSTSQPTNQSVNRSISQSPTFRPSSRASRSPEQPINRSVDHSNNQSIEYNPYDRENIVPLRVNRSIDQSINQSINQRKLRRGTQPVNQSVYNKPVSQSLGQSLAIPISEKIDHSVNPTANQTISRFPMRNRGRSVSFDRSKIDSMNQSIQQSATPSINQSVVYIDQFALCLIYQFLDFRSFLSARSINQTWFSQSFNQLAWKYQSISIKLCDPDIFESMDESNNDTKTMTLPPFPPWLPACHPPDIKFIPLIDSFIDRLIDFKYLRLLDLSNSQFVSVDRLVDLSSNLFNLQSINLSNNQWLTDDHLVGFVECKKLRSFILSNTRSITNQAVNQTIRHCQSLINLDLSSNPSINQTAIDCLIDCRQLRSINLSNNQTINHSSFLFLINAFPQLLILDISWTKIVPSFSQAVNQSMDQSISQSPNNSPYQSMFQSINSLQNLILLNLSYSKHLNDQLISESNYRSNKQLINQSIGFIKHLPNLQTLELFSCQLTDCLIDWLLDGTSDDCWVDCAADMTYRSNGLDDDLMDGQPVNPSADDVFDLSNGLSIASSPVEPKDCWMVDDDKSTRLINSQSVNQSNVQTNSHTNNPRVRKLSSRHESFNQSNTQSPVRSVSRSISRSVNQSTHSDDDDDLLSLPFKSFHIGSMGRSINQSNTHSNNQSKTQSKNHSRAPSIYQLNGSIVHSTAHSLNQSPNPLHQSLIQSNNQSIKKFRRPFPSLTALSVGGNKLLTTACLIRIIQSLEQLTALDIQFTTVDDRLIDFLVDRPIPLNMINLNWCNNIPKQAIKQLQSKWTDCDFC